MYSRNNKKFKVSRKRFMGDEPRRRSWEELQIQQS